MTVKKKKARSRVKTYTIGYRIGYSPKIHTMEICGVTTYTDCENGGEHGGVFGIMDAQETSIFTIPQTALVYCYVEAAKPKKKSNPVLISVPLHKIS